ncbi:MAG: ATP-dependent DNA helicase [Segniliparus sp.]|uniref:ATP-dependent DNA helicase n=1 Tax=Segniliparus sp. TaxID=2804064 RepID=UPI003F3C69C4
MPYTCSVAKAEPVNKLLDIAVGHLGGAKREPQAVMASAVAEALSNKKVLAVQAGPGTGKSLAYLVPAIAHAVRKGEPVVVSTATIALQRQLVDRDLPALGAALAESLGRAPTFALLKGRGNYLCLHKLTAPLIEEPEEPPVPSGGLFDTGRPSGTEHSSKKRAAQSNLGTEVARITEWSDATTTGDREELRPGVSDRAWRQFSVTQGECLGMSRCPRGTDCWAEKAKAVSAKVDVIVTNHAMLAIDLAGQNSLLPEHTVVVVDEAHELVDNVTSVATGSTGPGPVGIATRRCGKLLTDEQRARLETAGDVLGRLVAEAPEGFWRQAPDGAQEAVAALRDSTAAALTSISALPKAENAVETASRLSALTSLEDIVAVCDRSLKVFAQEDLSARPEAVWTTSPPSKDWREKEPPSLLHVAPVSVGGLLRERLFGEKTVVLTSATLTPGGQFDDLAGDWGLAGETAIPWSSLDVGSPFAHKESGICYIAKHLAPPGRDGASPEQQDVLRELIEAAGGRTLGLFSSLRAAQVAAEAMREALDTPVLCQGEDATGALIETFAGDPATSLFGTLSLWQGVDVPGPSLSLVVIDRIPFPRPDDPMTIARTHAAQAKGRNGFISVSASHAAVLLAQGFGRLLRSVSDRGVVAVLDSRLATARYAGYLKASLPPFWETTDLAVTKAALGRLREQADKKNP